MIKKHLKKIIAWGIVITSALAFNPIGVNAEWKNNSTGWWYSDGGICYTGWKLIDGNWYYFYSDGYMARNTTIDGYYLNNSGAWTNDKPVSQKIQGTWKERYESSRSNLIIDGNTIGGKPYTIIEEDSDRVIIEINEGSDTYRYMFKPYDNGTMMIYLYNECTNSYSGGAQYTRV